MERNIKKKTYLIVRIYCGKTITMATCRSKKKRKKKEKDEKKMKDVNNNNKKEKIRRRRKKRGREWEEIVRPTMRCGLYTMAFSILCCIVIQIVLRRMNDIIRWQWILLRRHRRFLPREKIWTIQPKRKRKVTWIYDDKMLLLRHTQGISQL